jgi:predicted Rossmann fold flavoprotein
LNACDVIVLGAGAAGLMCALTAGQRGRRVLVLERANMAGKKVLMSGGGRCNFTNLHVGPQHYVSANPHFCKSALSRYSQWDFIALVEKHGIGYHEKAHGRLFCDDSARAILSMLLQECKQAGVEVRSRCQVNSVVAETDEQGHRFRLATSLGEFAAPSLVVATGGLSIPTLGGSDFGYQLARQFGMRVLPRSAGLVPLVFTGVFQQLFSRLSGVSLPARVTAGGQAFLDDILFTHRGLSGPAILQLSSYWRPGEPVMVDLLPGQDALELLRFLKRAQPRSRLRGALARYLPKKLVMALERLWWPQWADTALAELPDSLLKDLAGRLAGWPLTPAATEGYRTAEVTLGGVDTRDLSSQTMESRLQPGLYFIGEVVDVTGQLGGYNFQWAWSSGYVAGQSV